MQAISKGMMTRRAALAGLAIMTGGSLAQAQTPVEFYKGKQIQMMVYSGAGSTYDTYARLLSRHMVRHIPGSPNIVVQNMIGAGGLKLVDYLNRIAPKDGTVFGTVSRGNPFDPIMGKKDIEFDPLKLTWIGSMNREVAIALSWGTSPVKTFEDVRKLELLVPGTGAGADSEIIPRAYNNLAGTKFKIVSGYTGKAEERLSVRRGETVGLIGWSWAALQTQEWDDYKAGNWRIIAHLGKGKHPEFDAPSIYDFATTPETRETFEFLDATLALGRPVFAPPGIPKDREAALRAGLAAALKDPAFLAEAQRQKLDISPASGEDLAERVERLYRTPTAVVERTQAVRKQALGLETGGPKAP